MKNHPGLLLRRRGDDLQLLAEALLLPRCRQFKFAGSSTSIEAVFSLNSENFMAASASPLQRGNASRDRIQSTERGFIVRLLGTGLWG